MQNYEVKLTFSGERSGRLNAKCRMQNAKFKLTFIVSAGRAVKCKMQNAKCKMKTTFFVSPFWVVVPKRMRELM